jgi:ABC-type nitrate/sulfonate/bicarbonate transport system substrate-binding protein
VRGWQWAVENPQEIGRLVKKRKPDADEAYNSAAMTAAIPLIHTGSNHIGWMTADDWRNTIDLLHQYREIDTLVDPDDVFTMEFLHRIYGRQ